MDKIMHLSVSKLNSRFVSYDLPPSAIMHNNAQHRLSAEYIEWLNNFLKILVYPPSKIRLTTGSIPFPYIWEKSFPKKFQFPIPLGKIRSSPRQISNFSIIKFHHKEYSRVSKSSTKIYTTLRSSSHQVLSVVHHLISCIPHRRFSRDRCCEYLACWPVRRSDFLVQHSVQINSLIVHELF